MGTENSNARVHYRRCWLHKRQFERYNNDY